MSSNTPQNLFRQELVEMIPRLRRFAYGLTGSTADGDDLVQTTLVRAIDREHQLRDDQGLRGWVFSILNSSWKNEVRSRSIRRGNGTVDAEQLTDHSLSACHETRQMRQNLHDSVMALPENFRCVVMLVDVEGFTYDEAATTLDIPRGTVMSRLARARKQLLSGTLGQEAATREPARGRAHPMSERAR